LTFTPNNRTVKTPALQNAEKGKAMDFHKRFSQFIAQLESDIYPEPPTPAALLPHVSAAIARTLSFHPNSQDAEVLDIGCGTGFALKTFADYGLKGTGIALGEDIRLCQEQGLNAIEMNMSNLDFPDQKFDIVWARHSLEHSPFPFFTLMEINRITKMYGLIYIEVPGAETQAKHEENPNHYSVLGKTMLRSLIERAGFQILHHNTIDGTTHAGAQDCYWSFIASKVKAAYKSDSP
jgi:SAM-dependent methyltransferase